MTQVYPFKPKSTAPLAPGQFWGIPLSDGSYGCGRVLQLLPRDAEGARVTFLAALMDWHSAQRPSATTIAGCKCVAQGRAHIKAITENGGMVDGFRPLELDQIVPWLFRGAHSWKNSSVQFGLLDLRPQTPDDDVLPIATTWGYNVITRLAEKTFL